MKVSNLIGAKLDYWVAIADGYPKVVDECIEVVPFIFDERCTHSYNGQVDAPYSPSTDWLQGGQIIEREGIKLKGGMFEKWSATLKTPNYKYGMEGPTFLIAAMRAFVASRFGVEVDDS